MEEIAKSSTSAARGRSARPQEVLRASLELGSIGVHHSVFLAAIVAAVLGRWTSRDEVVLGVQVEYQGCLVEPTLFVSPDRSFEEILEEMQGLVPSESRQGVRFAASTDGASAAGDGGFVFTWHPECGSGELALSFDRVLVDAGRMAVLLASVAEAARGAARLRRSGRALTLSQLPLVSSDMRARILKDFNDTRRPLPENATVWDLIAARVTSCPEATACVFEEASLTYAELGSRSASLAGTLAHRAIRKGDIVAVLTGNSLELPIAILACLRLGAVFVPLDEQWPAERLQILLRDAKPKAIVARRASQVPKECQDRLVLCCDADSPNPPATAVSDPFAQNDLAYGYPTSGSTGAPKCALNVHRGLLNRFLYMTRRYASGPREVVLQNSPPVFDSSLWQLLWPLTNGAKVVIPTATDHLDVQHTIGLIQHHAVTMTDFVPSVFNALVHHLKHNEHDVHRLSSLRALLIGGEEINPQACHRFRSLLPRVRLTNTYGPTEASIGMVFHDVEATDGNQVPIGRPIDNTHAVVLDAQRRLVPPGAVGELYIGGVCLGTGYLNDPERTAQGWIPNPFEELTGDRLYRTGDLVRQEPDGVLYFVGRSDRQVKIGGVRVELSEIEHALLAHPAVDAAVVCSEETPAGHHLVGYVVSSDGAIPADLKTFVSGRLPKQTVPSKLVFLDEIPLTHNGKLDRKRLAAMTTSPVRRPAGETSFQVALRATWSQLLGRTDFGIDDDFFLLGGDSLLVVHLVAQIAERFDVRLSPRAVYDTPTIRQLVSRITGDRSVANRSFRAADLRLAQRDRALVDDMAAVATPRASSSGPRRLLITGATGFVGAHVLAEILWRTEAEVLFLARDGDDGAAFERLRSVLVSYRLWREGFAERLVPVTGDLGSEALGLRRAEWNALAGTVDVLLNCAGAVNFLHDYPRHRPANVEGVARILRLAADGIPARVYHFSTLGAERVPGSPADGYGLSKWVAERIVERARSRGHLVTVHRVGEVMPHSLTGIPNANALSHLLIRSCLTLGLYPERLVALDYSPADWVARAIVDSMLGQGPAGTTVDLFHPAGTTLDAIMGCACAVGADVQPVGGSEFHRALESRCERDGDRPLQVLRSLLAAPMQERSTRGDVDAALSQLFALPRRFSPAHRDHGRSAASPSTAWPAIEPDLLRPMLKQAVGAHGSAVHAA